MARFQSNNHKPTVQPSQKKSTHTHIPHLTTPSILKKSFKTSHRLYRSSFNWRRITGAHNTRLLETPTCIDIDRHGTAPSQNSDPSVPTLARRAYIKQHPVAKTPALRVLRARPTPGNLRMSRALAGPFSAAALPVTSCPRRPLNACAEPAVAARSTGAVAAVAEWAPCPFLLLKPLLLLMLLLLLLLSSWSTWPAAAAARSLRADGKNRFNGAPAFPASAVLFPVDPGVSVPLLTPAWLPPPYMPMLPSRKRWCVLPHPSTRTQRPRIRPRGRPFRTSGRSNTGPPASRPSPSSPR